MLEFNLEYYRAFYYVAQLSSITKAAQALFLGQPAITRSIRLLEEHLGCRLFNRTAKGMQLTKEGEALYRHVEKAFNELMSGESELQKLMNFQSGTLKIATTETALHFSLLPAMEQFHKNYPDVSIHLTGSTTPEAVDLVLSQRVDLALAVSPIDEAHDLQVTTLDQFQDIVVGGQAFRNELEGRILSAQELSEYPIVTVEKGTSARKNTDHWFHEQGVMFESDFSVRTTSSVLPFVTRNLALGILPEMFARDLLASGELFQVMTLKSLISRKIILFHQNPKGLSRLCCRFIELIKR